MIVPRFPLEALDAPTAGSPSVILLVLRLDVEYREKLGVAVAVFCMVDFMVEADDGRISVGNWFPVFEREGELAEGVGTTVEEVVTTRIQKKDVWCSWNI